MRRLFLKTFLWFWLTVVLAIAALVLPNLYSIYASQAKWKSLAPDVVPSAARQAVDAYESFGERGLVDVLGKLQRDQSLQGYLLLGNREVLDPHRESVLDVWRVAQMAEEQGGLQVRGLFAAQPVRGAGGKMYTFVLADRDQVRSRAPLLELPLILLAAGTLFCYLITRHVTAPLFRLRAAASSIAEGKLDTRVGPALAHRGDEISDLARDFDKMAERIESLLTGQKNLLGDVSHELRSPLSRLNVALSLAQRSSAAEAPEHLERIQLEARRLDKLISQLLMLSRIDSGVHAGERSSVNFGNLVQEIASDADFEARATGRRVVVECADAATIAGSEEILRRAVENVLRNAVRHTREGTSVEVALRLHGSKAVLRVRDHGPGVPEPMLAEMFLPFRRAAHSASNGNSAGLGLAITERVLRAHGGSIRAENAREGGLVVEMEVPLTAARA